MRALLRFLLGTCRVFFFSDHPERILDFAHKNNLPVWSIRREKEGISFCVLMMHQKRLVPFFESLGATEAHFEEKTGFPLVFWRYRKRYGFFCGAVLFCVLLYLSTLYIWNVEVIGNEKVPDREVIALLAEDGLLAGQRIRAIDPTDFSLMFAVHHPEFSYVDLRVIGTRAIVEVRERELVPSPSETEGLVNMVARRAGVVVRMEVLEGQAQVVRGESVPEGALLISGVIEREGKPLRLVGARGRVFLQTRRHFETHVDFDQTETAYTGRQKVIKEYYLLGRKFSLSWIGRVPFEQFQTMERKENLTLFSRVLPIVCHEKILLETEEKNTCLTVDRARNLAYDEYENYKRETFAKDDEILGEDVSVTEDETGVLLQADLTCVENAAVEKPFRFADALKLLQKEGT